MLGAAAFVSAIVFVVIRDNDTRNLHHRTEAQLAEAKAQLTATKLLARRLCAYVKVGAAEGNRRVALQKATNRTLVEFLETAAVTRTRSAQVATGEQGTIDLAAAVTYRAAAAALREKIATVHTRKPPVCPE